MVCSFFFQSSVVDALRYKMKLLNQIDKENSFLTEQIWNEGSEIYRVTSGLIGSSVVRIGEFPLSICLRVQRERAGKVGDSCNEFYWTLKALHKPLPKSKWQYNQLGKPSNPSKTIDLTDVFDYSERNPLRSADINIRVRNWKQHPTQLLKKRVPPHVHQSSSNFAIICNSKLKCFSKCFLRNSELYFYNPVDMIL